MNPKIPTGFVQAQVRARIADLEFTFLHPEGWVLKELPAEDTDFTNPTAYLPLTICTPTDLPLVFAVAARPAFDDGTVSEWLSWVVREQGFGEPEIERDDIGPHPAVGCFAEQNQTEIAMGMRLAMLEDGGRIVTVSVLAPQVAFGEVAAAFSVMLHSFRLARPRGAKAALAPEGKELPPTKFPIPEIEEEPVAEKEPEKPSASRPAPASAAAPKTAAPQPAPAPAPQEAPPADASALAIADDAGTLDPEHPMNVRMRDAGAGLTPRVLATFPEQKCLRVGAGAIVATFVVPFGWHVMDDGRRTLVYDAGGKIQINMARLRRDGRTDADLLEAIRAEAMAQPGVEYVRFQAGGLECLALRGIMDRGTRLEQCYLLKPAPGDSVVKVRVTATPDDISRAIDLSEVLLRDMFLPE
ncbi:MAG: hypothetical protein JNJ88_04015 [Planctomycetes bacterium]|nr:hypothetical protein [Planctomycetota bacterium]